ncbi:hypothetical protein CU098_006440 [Rhizopus stolonifer]|uniref:Up-regulated during septation protein 1 domain-containing protein n=1 Tax=Rhizopus stolonifer TaxID=4846 RepID=A0A367J6N0_RHIST|nr:hypothetical protein CU098_006440 [Rhizopus stolonifer]
MPYGSFSIRESPSVNMIHEWTVAIQDMWHLKPTEPPERPLDLLTQLLVSQALLDSNRFQILSLDQWTALKSQNSELTERQQHLKHNIRLEKCMQTISPISSNLQLSELQHRWEYVNDKCQEMKEGLLKHTAAVLNRGLTLHIREREEIMERVQDTLTRYEDWERAQCLAQKEKELDLLWKKMSTFAVQRRGWVAERDQYRKELAELGCQTDRIEKEQIESKRLEVRRLETLVQEQSRMIDERDEKISRLQHRPDMREQEWKAHQKKMDCDFDTLMINYDNIITTAADLNSHRMRYEQRIQQLSSKVFELETSLIEEKIQRIRASNLTDLNGEFQKLVSYIQLNHEQKLLQEIQDKLLLKRQLRELQQQTKPIFNSIKVQTE